MKKLTMLDDTGKYVSKKIIKIKQDDELSEQNLNDIINKLAKYEELEEKERIIILPCNIGDKLYKICPINKRIQFGDLRDGKIVESDCQRCPYRSCKCSDVGFQRDADNIVREVTANDKEWILDRMEYFGKVYFKTKLEAEQFINNKLNSQ